jgi:transcription initiation factor IIE alpha subunit
MNKDKKIFTQHFTGSLDDLLAFTQQNADFVDDVVEGREEVMLDDKEAIQFVKEEFKEQYGEDITDEEAAEIMNEIKLEQVKDTIQSLIEDGLVEIKEYGEDGEPKYGLTEKGEALYPKK